jgi:hypothetical protein
MIVKTEKYLHMIMDFIIAHIKNVFIVKYNTKKYENYKN